MEEEDDDIYAPEENTTVADSKVTAGTPLAFGESARQPEEEDEEEGEEIEEDGSDSDIDIITERRGEPPAASGPALTKEPKQPVKKASITESVVPDAPPQSTLSAKPTTSEKDVSVRPGSSYPAVKTSNIDVNAKPVYEATGKAITDMDMDADFAEDDKPWRRPGTDMTDYFNYGFDEFTWASYCLKQSDLRKEVTDSKKQMEEMQNFLGSGMPGMPPMPGSQAGGAAPAIPPVNGPEGVPPEMQQMFQQMMAQGIDPSQMDPSQFIQMMQGGQMNGGAQGFGGQGFQNQQQMGYNYGAGGGGGGGGGGAGNRNQGGRGQGRRW